MNAACRAQLDQSIALPVPVVHRLERAPALLLKYHNPQSVKSRHVANIMISAQCRRAALGSKAVNYRVDTERRI